MNLIPFDGVMGFAYVNNVVDNSTILDRLYDQGQIKKKMACLKIHHHKDEYPSEVQIGGCDVEADYWVPVQKPLALYTVTLDKIVITSTTDKSELISLETNAGAVLDSGGTATVGND